MNILVVTPYYKPANVYGGPAKSVPALCEALIRCGANVRVYTTNANGAGKTLNTPTNRILIVDQVEVCYFPIVRNGARFIPFYSPDLGQACRADISQFDVVYILGSWTYPVFAGARSAFQHQVPYIISPRGSFMTWSMNEKAFKKRIYLALIERSQVNNAATIHLTSALEEQQIRRWRFTPSIQVIPNGVDLAPFKDIPRRGMLRQALGIPECGVLSLFVGRLHKEKRLHLVIQAFSIAAKKTPDAHLLIVGADQDGSGTLAQLQAQNLGLSDRIHFIGPLAGIDLLQAYSDADLLVLLSNRENFGMAALEAMAARLPVLVTTEVGLAREIEWAAAGIVVGDQPEEISLAWQKLLLDPAMRTLMGNRGRAMAEEQFDSRLVASRMYTLFASVCGRGHSIGSWPKCMSC